MYKHCAESLNIKKTQSNFKHAVLKTNSRGINIRLLIFGWSFELKHTVTISQELVSIMLSGLQHVSTFYEIIAATCRLTLSMLQFTML